MHCFHRAISVSLLLSISVAIDAQQVSTPAAVSQTSEVQAGTLSALQADCKYEDAMKEPNLAKQQTLLQQAIACVDAKVQAADAKAKAAAEQAAQARTKAAETQAAKDKVLATQVPKLKNALIDKLNKASKDPSLVVTTRALAHNGAPTTALQTGGGGVSPDTGSMAHAVNPAASNSSPSNFDVGTPASQSAYQTPDACSVGTDTSGRAAGQALLSVHRELLRQEDVQDDFGHRLGERFLVYQVSVTNASKDFQYEVGDISVDLEKVLAIQGADFTDAKGTPSPYAAIHQASGETLDMLRGVPEKGQDLDPRNLTLHILQGIGSVGAGVSGLTPFAGTMGSAMGNFNGAFLQALTGIAPDHTGTQLNRLSDMAFSSNTLIGKLQTRTFAVFIPKSFVLTRDNAKNFHKNPRTLLNWLPLDQVNVCVDGIMLVQVATTADPVFSSDVPRVALGASISLTDATPSADIYFTTNGDTPTTASTKYSTAFTIKNEKDAQLHIRAFSTAPNLAPSNVVDRTFTAEPAADAPTFPAPGADGKIVITPGNPGDSIYYTIGDATPGVKSTLYSAPFAIPSDQKGKKVNAIEIGDTTSYSTVATFTPTATQ